MHAPLTPVVPLIALLPKPKAQPTLGPRNERRERTLFLSGGCL